MTSDRNGKRRFSELPTIFLQVRKTNENSQSKCKQDLHTIISKNILVHFFKNYLTTDSIRDILDKS